MFAPNLDPNQQRVDAERVLQFLVNRLGVRGQIGVYGRSIGGIAASHLVKKFPNIVKTFVGDRTLGALDSMLLYRYHHGILIFPLYRMLSCFWSVNNGDKDFHDSPDCYKIHCFDYTDDVVDVFASHHHAIAAVHSRVDYLTDDWRQFYDSLRFIFSIELDMSNCDIIQAASKETLDNHMFAAMRKAEKDMAHDIFQADYFKAYEP